MDSGPESARRHRPVRRFVRGPWVEPSRKADAGSSGLGTPLAKHGAHIRAASCRRQTGKGSRVRDRRHAIARTGSQARDRTKHRAPGGAARLREGRGLDQAFGLYREMYRPSAAHPTPHGALCVWACTGETEAEAARLFSSREISRLNRDKGVFAALPSPEEAASYVLSDSDRARIERIRARSIYGTPDMVGAKLRALADEHQVEEIAILTTVHDPDARRRSYALLASEFNQKA